MTFILLLLLKVPYVLSRVLRSKTHLYVLCPHSEHPKKIRFTKETGFTYCEIGSKQIKLPKVGSNAIQSGGGEGPIKGLCTQLHSIIWMKMLCKDINNLNENVVQRHILRHSRRNQIPPSSFSFPTTITTTTTKLHVTWHVLLLFHYLVLQEKTWWPTTCDLTIVFWVFTQLTMLRTTTHFSSFVLSSFSHHNNKPKCENNLPIQKAN